MRSRFFPGGQRRVSTAFAGFFLLLALVVVVPAAHARTWHVEKDGSGDFTVIQDAIDAAASGDTIRIGVGRFEEFRETVSISGGLPFAGIAWIGGKELTLRGVGSAQTIVGPATTVEMLDGLQTASLYVDSGARVHIQDMAFENTLGVGTFLSSSTIESCRFERFEDTGAAIISVAKTDAVRISRCEVVGHNGLITAVGVSGLILEDSFFDDPSLNGIAVVIGNGARDCMVRGCTFRRGGAGVQFSFGSTGWVEDCRFEDIRVGGIDLSWGHAIVRRCWIGRTRIPLAAGQGRLEVYDTVLEGGTQMTIFSTTTIVMRNSHILNAGGPSVLGRVSAAGEILDLRNNWWGTSDGSVIESWIDDLYGTVLWQPFLTGPVPTESMSIGGLKGMFGGR